VERVYEAPFLAHATMEPMNCTADVKAGSCDVYVPTQGQTPSHAAAVAASGLSADKVKIHTTYMGGGFGRRGERTSSPRPSRPRRPSAGR
jgi:isoquinoline 1-oxidoreductase beta subunit